MHLCCIYLCIMACAACRARYSSGISFHLHTHTHTRTHACMHTHARTHSTHTKHHRSWGWQWDFVLILGEPRWTGWWLRLVMSTIQWRYVVHDAGGKRVFFFCVVLTATFLYHRCRLSCLPFVWHFSFIVTNTHTHTHTHTVCRCVCESACGCGTNFFPLLNTLPVYVYMWAGISECSTVSAIPLFPSSLLSVLALGPTVILGVHSCLDPGPETAWLQHVTASLFSSVRMAEIDWWNWPLTLVVFLFALW